MKNRYKNIIFFFLLFIFGTACEMKEELYSSLSPDNYYVNERGVESGVIAIYSNMNKPFDINDFGMPMFTFLTAPHATSRNPAKRAYSQFNFDPAESILQSSWSQFYKIINQANKMIEVILGISMVPEKKAELLAEAQVLRAYNYFHLVQLFGSVPLSLDATTNEEDAIKTFASVSGIYDAILEDLTPENIQALPAERGAMEKGRITKAAAMMLKGKVLLTMAGLPLDDDSKLAEAQSVMKELVDSCTLWGIGLVPDYSQIFGLENELNEEVIFAIQNTSAVDGNGTSLPYTSAPPRALPNNKGQYLYVVTQDFYNSFDPDDKRLSVFAYQYTMYNGTPVTFGIGNLYNYAKARGIVVWKYIDTHSSVPDQGGADFIIYRYADALLMLAEIENEINGPTANSFTSLNEVRNRAGISLYDVVNDPNGTAWTKESLREAIFQERLKELTFEFQEIYDIRRLGKTQWAVETSFDCIELGITYDPSMDLFPIPYNETTARNVVE